MRSGMLAAILVGLTCATLGVYVVLRHMAFIGDALAHTVLPGLVVAYLNSWNLFGGAVVAGLLTALGIGWLSRRQEVRLALITGVALLVLSVLALFHKELELTSFDPIHAEVIGLRADVVRYGLLMLLALTVVVGIQAVGVVLTNALLITPAASAALLTNRLPRMMVVAALIAIISGLAGLYASYYFSVSSGATIVLTCTACFGLAWLGQTLRRRATG
ncbi:MAG: metal ABC transporter permease [Chloroflexi bacterium]|nr:metal ABC transporter permease [Chloroflexota bacterium]